MCQSSSKTPVCCIPQICSNRSLICRPLALNRELLLSRPTKTCGWGVEVAKTKPLNTIGTPVSLHFYTWTLRNLSLHQLANFGGFAWIWSFVTFIFVSVSSEQTTAARGTRPVGFVTCCWETKIGSKNKTVPGSCLCTSIMTYSLVDFLNAT